MHQIPNSFCQVTTTIDYQTISPTNCNIFYPAINVNNVLHNTRVGQPKYNSSNKSVILECDNTSGFTKGTMFKLSFTFKQGYSYSIVIVAQNMIPSTFGNINHRVGIEMDNDPALNLNSSCTGTENISSQNNLQTITSGAFFNYTYNFNTLSFAFSRLNIYAVPLFNGIPAFQTIEIKKITITETPPAASFNVTSSPTTITCGTATPVTFTVNNGAGTIGITGYNWGLGATPNGWLLPNGTAAPATYSTGTANTLTLTPVCGKALSSVSATVIAGGTNYNTNNAGTVSIAQPFFSISGSSAFCSGSTAYTINGLPCNASIAWAAPASGFGSLSSLTTSPTTLTYGGTSGTFTLTANVTSCAATTPVTLPVHVGAYTVSDYTLSGNNGSTNWCPNQTISFGLSGAGSSNYSWTIPTGWSIVYNSNVNYIAIRSPASSNPPTGTLSVSFTEPCGTTLTKNIFLTYNSSACTTSPYTLSPNPASSYLTIACTSLQTYCNIAAVQITDLYGNVLSSQSWPYTNQSVQMSVSFLQNGNYIAKTYDGTQWYSNQFIVQH